jgi:RNA polymerase sigma factor (sigma-70 family)
VTGRPDVETPRPGVDPQTTRVDGTNFPPPPVAPSESTERPNAGSANLPPALGDSAPVFQPRFFDDGGTNGVRPDSGAVGVTETEVIPLERAAEPTEATAIQVDVRRAAGDVSDALLLHRFVANGEQAAFTALVRRHERFVLGVCERVLGDPHAARDAVQLTFLVLARKAGLLDRHGPLAGWLWTVASRQALRLRAVIARRRRKEKQAANDRASQEVPESAAEEQEARDALREELQRLPEKYRAPLVLCYLAGRTHDEAARALGMPRGSMAKRIAEALDRLRERLIARGFAP